jgi:hypothetical protein
VPHKAFFLSSAGFLLLLLLAREKGRKEGRKEGRRASQELLTSSSPAA